MKGICESCEEEKDVTDIEDHLLCSECAEDIVRCDNCNAFLGINYDALEVDNFGTLGVPELHLPNHLTSVIFCNKKCLTEYLEKNKDKLDELCGVEREIRTDLGPECCY